MQELVKTVNLQISFFNAVLIVVIRLNKPKKRIQRLRISRCSSIAAAVYPFGQLYPRLKIPPGSSKLYNVLLNSSRFVILVLIFLKFADTKAHCHIDCFGKEALSFLKIETTRYTAILKVPVYSNWVPAFLDYLFKVGSIQLMNNVSCRDTPFSKDAPSAPCVVDRV